MVCIEDGVLMEVQRFSDLQNDSTMYNLKMRIQ